MMISTNASTLISFGIVHYWRMDEMLVILNVIQICIFAYVYIYVYIYTSITSRWMNNFLLGCFTAGSIRLCGVFGEIHYNDIIVGAMASQITSLAIVYSTVYSGVDQRKHQSSASLVFVQGIHRWSVNSPLKWPVTRKMFPFDDVTI